MSVQSELEKLSLLKEEVVKQREHVLKVMHDVVCSIGQNPEIKTLRGLSSAFTIRLSSVVGNPLSSSFYDWRKQEEILYGILSKVDESHWVTFIQLLLKERVLGTDTIKRNSKIACGSVVYTVDCYLLNYDFIKSVCEKL